MTRPRIARLQQPAYRIFCGSGQYQNQGVLSCSAHNRRVDEWAYIDLGERIRCMPRWCSKTTLRCFRSRCRSAKDVSGIQIRLQFKTILHCCFRCWSPSLGCCLRVQVCELRVLTKIRRQEPTNRSQSCSRCLARGQFMTRVQRSFYEYLGLLTRCPIHLPSYQSL